MREASGASRHANTWKGGRAYDGLANGLAPMDAAAVTTNDWNVKPSVSAQLANGLAPMDAAAVTTNDWNVKPSVSA